MKTTPTKGACHCRRGQQRDNCPDCEGTGIRIDFAAIRAAKTTENEPRSLAGSYRTQDGKAQIEWELTQKENGPEFSASGDYDGGFGQNLEEIARAYPLDSMVQRIAKVWHLYHLNGMNAGTPEQAHALEEEKKNAVQKALAQPSPERFFWNFERRELNPHTLGAVYGLKDSDHYSWACHVLKERGLYEVPLSEGMTATGGFPGDVTNGARGYRYGERWVYLPIPDDVLSEIKSWSDAPTPKGSLADHKTEEFLKNNCLKFRAVLSNTKPANWQPSGHHYRVTLSGRKRRLSFDFWDSAKNAEEGKELSPTSVLSCIASDIHTPETFDEFCSEYGEEPDSIKALQTFKRCARHAERLRAFFTEMEQRQLADIR